MNDEDEMAQLGALRKTVCELTDQVQLLSEALAWIAHNSDGELRDYALESLDKANIKEPPCYRMQ